jgi:hypothetical protein
MQDRGRLNDALRHYSEYSGDLEKVDLVPAAKVPAKPGAARKQP